MENYRLEKDINVFCMNAETFPDGVASAHDKLHALLPADDQRIFYGVSHGSKNGKIIYKAAVEEKQKGEGTKYGCESFTIRKGNYVSTVVRDFMKDLSGVGRAFEKMLKHPQLDPDGYCLEVYFNQTDVQCMVRLRD